MNRTFEWGVVTVVRFKHCTSPLCPLAPKIEENQCGANYPDPAAPAARLERVAHRKNQVEGKGNHTPLPLRGEGDWQLFPLTRRETDNPTPQLGKRTLPLAGREG